MLSRYGKGRFAQSGSDAHGFLASALCQSIDTACECPGGRIKKALTFLGAGLGCITDYAGICHLLEAAPLLKGWVENATRAGAIVAAFGFCKA